MVVFGVVVAALVLAGTGLAVILWKRLDGAEASKVSGLELVTAGAILGCAAWIGASWIFALTHTLTATALWILAGVVVAAAIPSVLRLLPTLNREAPPGATRVTLLVLPVVLWSGFALWRGAVVPPASHDALAYHLPRALMMARAGGLEQFPSADTRLNSYPANYELLLADVILMSGSDRLTEWLSTAMFLLFLLAAAAMTKRWWKNTNAVGEVVLATAVTPLLLLHSSAHKNDLMASFFALSAILWGARWCARGGRMPMLLLVASLVLGGGTKPQVVGVLAGLAPFLILRAVSEWRAGRLRVTTVLLTGVLVLAFFAIGGAAPYVMLLTEKGDPSTPSAGPFPWGDLENLWQVPVLMLMAPFSSNDLGVWVPWRREYWFWPRYEIYFSNYGALFSVIVALLPIALLASRRRDEDGRSERRVGALATLLAVILLLPTEIRPVGFFAALGRYLLFVVPVVIARTLPPLIDFFRASSGVRRLPALLIGPILAGAFVWQAVQCAVKDTFTPLKYVRLAAELPGTRTIWFKSNRAASVVDRMAGPRDTIAVVGAFDTWIYPAYGAQLTREVILLPWNATETDVPASADWIIIDRSWNSLWEHPGLTDMGKFWQYAGLGKPAPEDLRVYSGLLHDPRFRLVYRHPRINQAIFWRIGSTQGPEPREWRGPRD